MTFDLDAHFQNDERETRGRAPFSTPLEKYSPSQPRDSRGRWTDGLGTVHTGDVDTALSALGEGHHVRLDEARKVAVLLDKMRDLVADAKAKGKDAPTYDLCKVTVPGTNIFCGEHKGIPRAQMPQLKGIPTPGSKADAFPRDPRGEVSLNDEFRRHLIRKGIVVSDANLPAAWLKATQRELNGAKVAGIAKAYQDGQLARERLFVTGDGYIIDGHHRWASILGTDLADNIAGDHLMEVAQIHMPVLDVIAEANAFAEDWGIPQASLTSGFGKGASFEPFNLLKYSPDQPRVPKGSSDGGQFASAGGSSASAPLGNDVASIDLDEATRRLQAAFPKALLDNLQHLDGGALAGVTRGLERMAEQFPNVAKDVALVRAGPGIANGMAQHIITTVRKPDGSEVTGYGFLFNSDEMNYDTPDYGLSSDFKQVLNIIHEQGGWGRNDGGVWTLRSNSFSIDSHDEYAESNAVHEFGHAVHNLATARGVGLERGWSGTEVNRLAWEDAAFGFDDGYRQNQALLRYAIRASESNALPPTLYAGQGHLGELFAESFTFRHGPDGVGLMDSVTLDSDLEDIVQQIERDAR